MSFNDWKLVRLGDICIVNQKTYSLSENWPFVNYLDTGNVTENRIYDIQHIVIGQDALPSRARRKVDIDDIIYSTVRPNQKHYAIIKNKLPNMLVSTGFAVITVDKKVADSDFVYYFLTQTSIVDKLHSIAEQSVSTYPSIKPSDIENIELMLPPLDEQKQIGCLFRILDDKIAINTAINQRLEQIAQAIFKSWFVDFEPFGGEMPSDWQEGTLSDICTYSSDRVLVSSLSLDTYISTENMVADRGGYVTAKGLPTVSQTTGFTIGDTLISNIRPYFKKIVYCDFSGGCSTDVLCFRPIKDNLSLFVYYSLYSDDFFDYMVAGSKGTKMPRGDKQQIMNYRVVIPADSVVKKFTNLVLPMVKAKSNLNEESTRLATIRDTLLPRLMSGELSVADLKDIT